MFIPPPSLSLDHPPSLPPSLQRTHHDGVHAFYPLGVDVAIQHNPLVLARLVRCHISEYARELRAGERRVPRLACSSLHLGHRRGSSCPRCRGDAPGRPRRRRRPFHTQPNSPARSSHGRAPSMSDPTPHPFQTRGRNRAWHRPALPPTHQALLPLAGLGLDVAIKFIPGH